MRLLFCRIAQQAALFQQIGQRAVEDARCHFGVIEREVEQRTFVDDYEF